MSTRGSSEADNSLNSGPGRDQFVLYTVPDSLVPRRAVYAYGNGPPVIVLHEVFGATPELFRFAYRIAREGFSTFVPVLFGDPDRKVTRIYQAEQLAYVCLSFQFALLSKHQSGRITGWLRALGGIIHERFPGPGIGVVGLCLTGSYALAMMADAWTLAPVVSEPALPFCRTKAAKAALHLSDDQIETIRRRISKEHAEILAFRFSGDRRSPPERYRNLRRTFSPGVSGCGFLQPTQPGAHSVFTEHFDQRPGSSTAKALDDVIAFLKRKLM